MIHIQEIEQSNAPPASRETNQKKKKGNPENDFKGVQAAMSY